MLQVYMLNNTLEFENIYERADLRLFFLCMILGLTSWTGLCRLLRGESMKLREVEYVQASYTFGLKKISIIVRHIIPNIMHIVIITVVLDFSALVLAEAVLSYVNIGVDPTTYSWGNMINAARLEMSREPIVWWSLFSAFLFMFILVFRMSCETIKKSITELPFGEEKVNAPEALHLFKPLFSSSFNRISDKD